MPLERSNVPLPDDDDASAAARTVNNASPCCGKRPRSEATKDEEYGDSNGLAEEEEEVKEPEEETKKPAAKLHQDASLEAAEGDEGDPYARRKVARSSPIPRCSQDAPPATTAATGRRKKKDAPLPLAANLREFMKPGAPLLFRPRPEWYLGDQNGNPNSTRRRRATPPRQQALPNIATMFPIPGLMIAPDSGLLPDGMFDVFANPMVDGQFERYGNPPPQASDDPEIPNTTTRNAQVLEPEQQQQQQKQPKIPLLSTFGRDFDPALHVTIRESATEAALALLQFGAPTESENAKGVTPLILAAQKGNTFLVRELLRRGAIASRASSNGTTAVLQAAHFGHLECLELLFRAGGVSLMEMANFNHTTPLMRAAQEGHIPCVQFLLERGASVNRRNRVQMTALMLASQRGHGKVCQVLVNKGAELDSMTAQHSTSLLLACKRGHLDVVRVLVAAGCELWVKDSRGRTAREVAQRRDMKDLVPLIDSNVQLDLMQRQQRRQRNYDITMLWNLLQQERAVINYNNNDNNDNEEGGEEVALPPSTRHVTIHQMMQEMQQPNKVKLSMSQPCHLPPTLPYHLSQKSTQALLRTMALPAPLVEMIARFLPMPPLWDRRLGMLTNRSVLNADASITCALDLIDEILEEGGFVEACDFAQVVPPTHFGSWRDWRRHCRIHCTRGGCVQLPEDHPRNRPIATSATVPKPKDAPSMLEMRRQVGFLQLLAHRTPVLAHVLAHQPYNMPRPLIQQLITTSDIQSLVRRMGSRGVHFESTVAMDLILLVSRLCSWYSREREDKPYPMHPAVVHPPLPQPRQRPLPMRVPLDLVTTPFQYDPYQRQQQHTHPEGEP